EDVPMEVCDINKHVAGYEDMFRDFTDIETYFCPDFSQYDNKTHKSIHGLYGSNFGLGYYNFYIHRCKENCESEEYVRNYLESTFVDTRTIEYTANSLTEVPYKLNVRSDRIPTSLSIYKRIWMDIQHVQYNT